MARDVILVVDDSLVATRVLSNLFAREGFDVRTARSGVEALGQLQRDTPDLVILDIKMPGMDGLTAAEKVVEEDLAAVLILTAFSQRDLIERARDAGALAYLVKPFDRNDLVPQIEVALGRHQEIVALSKEVKGLEQQIETRRTVDRAKGILMDDCGLKEHEAFTWIQRTAMRQRRTMKEIALQVIEQGLRPYPS